MRMVIGRLILILVIFIWYIFKLQVFIFLCNIEHFSPGFTLSNVNPGESVIGGYLLESTIQLDCPREKYQSFCIEHYYLICIFGAKLPK